MCLLAPTLALASNPNRPSSLSMEDVPVLLLLLLRGRQLKDQLIDSAASCFHTQQNTGTPSLAEKAEQALTWECVFGRGEGKTVLRIEETLLKEKCLIFSGVFLLIEKTKHSLSVPKPKKTVPNCAGCVVDAGSQGSSSVRRCSPTERLHINILSVSPEL
ncbi:hypothetical protein NQZ68_021654, partial [Dissostichus eleginoides]